MKRAFKFFVLTFCPIFIIINAYTQDGYEIKLKISALKDSTILLGHHFAKESMLIPDDTIKLDKKGNGVFKGKKALPGGMYIIFLPSKKYFDVLLDKNQYFSIESDTFDFLKKVKFTKSIDNQLFYQYQNLITEKGQQAKTLVNLKKKSNSQTQKDSITKAIDQINQEVTGFIKNTINNNPSTIISVILKGLQEIEVPDPPKDVNGKITDSTFQYRYYEKHYFDNFSYSDQRLLRTPFYEQKVKNYITKVIPQIPDSIIKYVDMIIDNVKGNDELFRYLLVTFFNEYASSQVMGQDAVFVHISEKYYIPYATWATKDYIEKLKKEVAKKKPNLIGNIAPNLKLVEVPSDHFMVARTDTALKSNPYVGNNINLLDIKAKYLLIIFWEADCGHCKKAMPLLYDSIYPLIKDKGVKILAIHMISSIEGKRKWVDFVNEHNMYDWINAWSPYSYEYKDLYDVYTTPVIYILDENKKIIAKRIGPEQAAEIINFEENRKK